MPRLFPREPGPLPLLLLLCLLVAPLFPGEALAHRVNIFAWLDGGHIIVECGFNRSSPVRGGLVTVYDATDGKELVQGRTDAQGVFSFPVPGAVREGHGLRIEVNAGEGHVNDWTMTAAEIAEAQDLSHGFHNEPPAATPAAPATPPAPAPDVTAIVAPATSAITAPAASAALSATEVRAIVAESLSTGLAPIRRELAALASPEPGLRDIVGGLGWIMGLIGIACWFSARRKQQKP